VSKFLHDIMEQRRKFLDGLDANAGDINLDIFEDFYPDKAHFVFELLQNAEDTGATEAAFRLTAEGCYFEHNGTRPFTKDDVRAITGIHNSTKTKSSDQIGKFGVGFKAVFVYTLTPTIYSADFSFRISRLVMPEPVPGDQLVGDRTIFWLPFNNPKKPCDTAYQEVLEGLEELTETTLLFLSHIKTVKWAVERERTGEILRLQHSDKHFEVLKRQDGTDVTSLHFLKFDQPVAGMETQRVAVAYVLDFLPKVENFDDQHPLAKQMKIVPATPGKVAVFFPAEKEASGLRFHLHGPFVPELSRASIKDTPANQPIFEQLATLAAASLNEVHDLGLLTVEFLGVLPNSHDSLPERYTPILMAIIEAMKTRPLTPTYSKTHAPGCHLLQAKASLKELLSGDDIRFLVNYGDVPFQWVANAPQKNSAPDRFLSCIGIREWDTKDFLEVLAEKADETSGEPDEMFMAWLSTKPVDWLQSMYAMLAKEPETEDELFLLDNARVVRITDGTFCSGDKSYFPDENEQYIDVVPCVDSKTYRIGSSEPKKEAARKFLEKLGVQEIGERQLINALLEKKYKIKQRPLNEDEYIIHLERFLKLANDEPWSISIFSKYDLFIGADGKWHPAKEIYLDLPYADTGMSDYFDIVGSQSGIVALADFYKDLPIDLNKLVHFVVALGALQYLPINKVSCKENPEWDALRRAPGARSTNVIDEDYRIEKFRKLAAAWNVRISRLIWNTMNAHCNGKIPKNVLNAIYRKSKSGGPICGQSQLVHHLMKFMWVPQGEKFVRPADARAELLPSGFIYESGSEWIKAIKFGSASDREKEKASKAEIEANDKLTRQNAAAKELGFVDPSSVERAQRFAALPVDAQERFLEESERIAKMELPEQEPVNPERRSERVRDQAGDAPERRTEERTRSVSPARDEVVKEFARPYLRSQYTKDGVMFCQICGNKMPFKLPNGEWYFETVEFLPSLKRRSYHYQNYLALCPNHAAMFKHASGSKDIIAAMFRKIGGNKLEVELADRAETIYFTATHVLDLKAVIEAETRARECDDSDIQE
jgi:hypothetical protein